MHAQAHAAPSERLCAIEENIIFIYCCFAAPILSVKSLWRIGGSRRAHREYNRIAREQPAVYTFMFISFAFHMRATHTRRWTWTKRYRPQSFWARARSGSLIKIIITSMVAADDWAKKIERREARAWRMCDVYSISDSHSQQGGGVADWVFSVQHQRSRFADNDDYAGIHSTWKYAIDLRLPCAAEMPPPPPPPMINTCDVVPCAIVARNGKAWYVVFCLQSWKVVKWLLVDTLLEYLGTWDSNTCSS